MLARDANFVVDAIRGRRMEPFSEEWLLWCVRKDIVTGCWEWLRGKDSKGYARVGSRVHKSKLGARAFYEKYRGPLGSLHACHKCDNPGCVSQEHIFPGTAVDNMKDMVAKGRSNPRRGTHHGCAKLNAERVLEIRTKWASGEYTQQALADMHGISQMHVSQIVLRKRWRHLPEQISK